MSVGSIDVLHVDDDPDILELAALFLEREDDRFQVEGVTSAEEGLDRLQEEGFDCVISDYDMPGRSGIEFLRSVRESSPDLPFILFTGKGSEEVASDAISAGVTDYLQKGTGTDQYTVLANRLRNAVERHRAERASERIRRRLEAIIEANPDFVFLLDEDAQYQEIIAGSAEITTYDPEEFIGRRVGDLWPEEPAARIQRAIRTTIETGESQRIEYELPITDRDSGDGRTAWYEGRTAVVEFEQDGRPTVLLTAREVTDRKARERRLRTAQQAVENAGHQIYWTEPDETIVYVNPAFEEATGYSAEEAIGNTPRILKSGEHDQAFYEEMWETILAGEVWRSEIVNRTKSGERYVVDQTIAPVVGDGGEIEHFVAINADVTDRASADYE